MPRECGFRAASSRRRSVVLIRESCRPTLQSASVLTPSNHPPWPRRSVDCTSGRSVIHIRSPQGGFHERKGGVRLGGRGAVVAAGHAVIRRRGQGGGNADCTRRLYSA